MAARDFKLLADILPSVQTLVDQPATDPSQMAFTMAQFADAANGAQEELHYMASQLDCDWCTKEAIVSPAAGATWIALPADCRAVRSTVEWNSSTNRKVRDLACGEWSQLGVRNYDSLFKPKDTEHSNQATLRFLRPLPRAMTIKVVYDYFPARLVLGCLPADAGALSMPLAPHEPSESGVLVGVTLYITEDEIGGAYGNQAITGWDGKTRTATFAVAWSPVAKSGAKYSSRPDLPREWERLFVLEAGVQAGLKLPDRLVKEWGAKRKEAAVTAKHRAATVDRRAAKIIRSRSTVGRGFTGDPINGSGSW